MGVPISQGRRGGRVRGRHSAVGSRRKKLVKFRPDHELDDIIESHVVVKEGVAILQLDRQEGDTWVRTKVGTEGIEKQQCPRYTL